MAALLLARLGLAHTLGVSFAELVVASGGRVDAQLTFAGAEPFRGATMVDADPRAFVLGGLDVAADGVSCPGTFDGSTLTEADGLVLAAHYACPADASEIELTAYYFADLPAGHRTLARIRAGSATSQAILRADRRGLALELPRNAALAARRARRSKLLVGVTAGFTVFMLVLIVWRWRATRVRKT